MHNVDNNVQFNYLRTWWSIRYISAVHIVYIFSDYEDKKKDYIQSRQKLLAYLRAKPLYQRKLIFDDADYVACKQDWVIGLKI